MKRLVHLAAARFRRHVRELWRSRGGGFYGFVAVLTFLYLEVVDLAGDLAGIRLRSIDLGWAIGFLVDNFVDALMNLVRSVIWPAAWIQRFGVGALSGALLAGAYIAYRLIRPTVIRLLEEDTDQPPPSTSRSTNPSMPTRYPSE